MIVGDGVHAGKRDDLAFFRLELRRQIYDLFIRFALPVQHPCIIKLLWRAEGNLLIATVRYDKCKKEHHPYPDRYGNDRQYIQLSKTPFIHRLLYHPKMPHGFLDAVLFYRIRTVRSSLSHFLCFVHIVTYRGRYCYPQTHKCVQAEYHISPSKTGYQSPWKIRVAQPLRNCPHAEYR